MSTPDRWDQKLAVEVVVSVLGGKSTDRDFPGGPPDMHDFDVHLEGGRVIAVEVVRFTDRPQVQQFAEIQRRSWEFQGLERGWHVTVEPDASIRRLHEEVVSQLRVLEARGIERLQMKISPTSVADGEAKAAVTRLAELRVVAAATLDAIPPGQLIISPRQPASWTGQDLIVEMIDSKVRDKLDKLARADANERHLFIWVEYAQAMTMAALAFADGTLPGVVLPEPVLPVPIDAVWIVDVGFPTAIRFYQRGRGWSISAPWQPSD